MTKLHLYRVEVRGDLGLKTYFIIAKNGGMKGDIEAKDMGEAAYKEELELAKDRVEGLQPKEMEVFETDEVLIL